MKTLCYRMASAALLLLVLAAAAPQAHAQKVGTTSMQFLKVAPTARAMSMGGAYAAFAGGAGSLYWNPAGLTAVTGHSLQLDRIEWLLDTSHNAVAYGGDLGGLGHLGVHFYMVDVGSIRETSVAALGFQDLPDGGTAYQGYTGATFSPSAWVLGVTYARRLTDRFSAGLTAKYAREDLYRAQVGVPLFDFGMNYDTGFRSLRLGASVLNFGPPVEFSAAGDYEPVGNDGEVLAPDDSYPAPMTFRIGVAADLVGPGGLMPVQSTTNRLTASYDLIQPNDYDQQWSAGLEYMFVERFALRGGYQHNFDTASFSFGAGVRQPVSDLTVLVDYAYSDMTETLGAVHRFSIGLQLD